MSTPRLALKVDVDTDRGAREGVLPLARFLAERGIKATFLFALGPDNTGRAIRRIFRPGFFQKVSRTSVVSVYGWHTLLNGVLWPGPNIATRNAEALREVHRLGHEVGIHCWDHVKWQDGLARMQGDDAAAEIRKARQAFRTVFGFDARTAGAAGWQADAKSLAAYDACGFDYASDARGRTPFFPRARGRVFATLQIPTTLPTLDELLGRPEYPQDKLADAYRRWLREDALNVMTIHAELEGMAYRSWFQSFVDGLRGSVAFTPLADEARACLSRRVEIPVCELAPGMVDGRSGTLAVQGA
ncbi:MAG: 4-deoxy-4-formamido-L-arabinose-phosphoundecaprenol deformylase [Alphaproteobacteria bacterium]|nr:4-deoxy-4-formamido-L-arabinose-phosphoundecaprenol deformylase [Alphaproteobacteria bacterium]